MTSRYNSNVCRAVRDHDQVSLPAADPGFFNVRGPSHVAVQRRNMQFVVDRGDYPDYVVLPLDRLKGGMSETASPRYDHPHNAHPNP